MVGTAKGRPVGVVPGRGAPGMSGRALVADGMVADGMVAALKMGPPGMVAVSRCAVRQAAPGMRSVQAVGGNVVPLSGAAVMGSALTEIALPEEMLLVIGSTEPAAAQIGPSLAIGPVWSAVVRRLAHRREVPLSADPRNGGRLIVVLAAVPLAVLLGALALRGLGLAGPMGPGPIVASLMPPVLKAAVTDQVQGPGH